MWHHGDALGIGKDHDDQVDDALKLGAFVGGFTNDMGLTSPELFLQAFEEIFLSKKRQWEWWYGTPYLDDNE
ncbi:MAG: hypothetical protein Q8R25_01440 [bacterium]|nr:hypothetical protein [bacterium]